MLNKEFLTALLSKEDMSAEDKISQILAEKEADERGLVQKRDELLGSEKKLKEQISALTDGKTEYESKISDLEERLKKASSDDVKKYYETQIADLTARNSAEIKKVSDERDYFRNEHLNALKNQAFENGMSKLQFVDGLREGFKARVLSLSKFEPKEIDGKTIFLDGDNHTIEDVISTFALSDEGKAYIRNQSSGGGARGADHSRGNGKAITRSQFDEMRKNNPVGVQKFIQNGGTVVD